MSENQGQNQSIANLRVIRDALFDIIMEKESGNTDTNADSDTVLTQNVGVALTKAARQQGSVNIFQMQSVTLQKVTGHAVKALKLLDIIIENRLIEVTNAEFQLALPPPEQEIIDVTERDITYVEVPDAYDKVIEAFFEVMAVKQPKLKEFLSIVTEKYIEAMHKMYPIYNKAQMERILGVTSGYLSRKKNKIPL